MENLKLEIRSEPPFTVATSWRIDEVADGKSIPVVNPDVQLDAGYLNKLTEAVRGSLPLALRGGETEIAREIETPTQSFDDGIVFPEPKELDREYSPEQIFAPLSAYSSQLSAVVAAAKSLKPSAVRRAFASVRSPGHDAENRLCSTREALRIA